MKKPLWRAHATVGVFFLGVILLAVFGEKSTLPGGAGFIAAGILALVWHGELAELDRRLKRGAGIHISDEGHVMIALLWGFGVAAIGTVLVIGGVGGCG